MTADRWLIAGLGNPGEEYAANRHNAGAMVVGVLAGRLGARLRPGRLRAATAEGQLAGFPVTLSRPLAYMNESGGPVAGLCRYYRLPAERVVVIHDDMDLPYGALRLKLGGGDGGHNGLRSISRSLGTRDYHRVRIGIGRPPGRMDPAVFVLRDFAAGQREELPLLLERGADAVTMLLAEGLAAAQNAFHPDGGGAPKQPS